METCRSAGQEHRTGRPGQDSPPGFGRTPRRPGQPTALQPRKVMTTDRTLRPAARCPGLGFPTSVHCRGRRGPAARRLRDTQQSPAEARRPWEPAGPLPLPGGSDVVTASTVPTSSGPELDVTGSSAASVCFSASAHASCRALSQDGGTRELPRAGAGTRRPGPCPPWKEARAPPAGRAGARLGLWPWGSATGLPALLCLIFYFFRQRLALNSRASRLSLRLSLLSSWDHRRGHRAQRQPSASLVALLRSGRGLGSACLRDQLGLLARSALRRTGAGEPGRPRTCTSNTVSNGRRGRGHAQGTRSWRHVLGVPTLDDPASPRSSLGRQLCLWGHVWSRPRGGAAGIQWVAPGGSCQAHAQGSAHTHRPRA
ncbi:uncharacterized protein LOC124990753 [Sciurus carolinensis]|uniref:uncharacterized protein LOC124990753 n=1 Tax=Sciurus carolinensis TaxID=30640 RepID=UPI001FB1CFC3|nr:uncharacterized protein LOC124990753 [Sciurus carolinensis]XP_047417029.1 uncharacterized protein LOC124990753 [Sciurus carolinensis]XP_047417030.1 uncharacterized protein LOC124990753 [Sciurus carolinensis]XP_047417031.1 uncharacterized protein LOC124990753 [Sciurus carolinensis]XP_047417032.1 uncharacterized protein LOC124990753 [Sciurus carolinensis]XP_047417033.1 uncharacterized protein LOC124990753 [Sciurus carolinensis]XP_047417034.1 uncharacterized protein LOC124990753 [Sciurus caro